MFSKMSVRDKLISLTNRKISLLTPQKCPSRTRHSLTFWSIYFILFWSNLSTMLYNCICRDISCHSIGHKWLHAVPIQSQLRYRHIFVCKKSNLTQTWNFSWQGVIGIRCGHKMTFDLINIQRIPHCIFDPGLVTIGLQLFKGDSNNENQQFDITWHEMTLDLGMWTLTSLTYEGPPSASLTKVWL